jgi:hypothetical protein
MMVLVLVMMVDRNEPLLGVEALLEAVLLFGDLLLALPALLFEQPLRLALALLSPREVRQVSDKKKPMASSPDGRERKKERKKERRYLVLLLDACLFFVLLALLFELRNSELLANFDFLPLLLQFLLQLLPPLLLCRK